jgi:EAL domain-containing protein (putative c-di-GMP-specific phosphodiesterase class I)
VEQDLSAALAQLSLHYQPIVDLNTGAVAGCEALARLDDGSGGTRSIGPVIEAVENDPDLLELLMRKLLGVIEQEAVPLFERYPDFYVSVNVPPAILGTRKIGRMLEELDLYPHLKRRT